MQNGRFWVFVGVAAMHAVVIVLFKNSLRQPDHRRSDVYYSTWVVSDPTLMSTPRQPIKKRNARIEKTERQSSAPDISVRVAEEDIAPQTDWRAAGGESIRETIDRLETDPPLGSGAKRPVQEDEKPPSLFDAPLYRRGDSNRFDDGEVNTWINSRCYVTNRPYSRDPDNPNKMHVICEGNAGKRKADDDLFEHLRPKYLREAPATATP